MVGRNDSGKREKKTGLISQRVTKKPGEFRTNTTVGLRGNFKLNVYRVQLEKLGLKEQFNLKPESRRRNHAPKQP